MNYVIIGNSTAAVGCIEQIRKTDQKGKITVISDEPYHTYGRPLISYYLLGRVDAAHMNYRPADFYEKNGVKTLLGVRAERIDPAAKKVFLQGGKSVPYDKLLVATGSRPFVPPMDGYDTVKEKFTFMTFADALALEKALSPEKDVLIVGAGLTGLKCMEGILARVKSVTVVDLAGQADALPRWTSTARASYSANLRAWAYSFTSKTPSPALKGTRRTSKAAKRSRSISSWWRRACART